MSWAGGAVTGLLSLGGWLVLGSLGRELASRWLGGQAVVALWLMAVGLAFNASARLRPGSRAAGGLTVASGAATAALLQQAMQYRSASLLAAAAVTWALCLAGAAQRSRQPASFLFCVLALPPLASWRRPLDWPLQCAVLAMLPMMLALPAMGGWCGLAFGSSADVAIAHLGAMLLPALCCRGFSLAARRAVVSVLLGVSLLALLRPGLSGLMATSLLQSAAWSVARASRPSIDAQPSALGVMAGPAAVLLLGAAIEAHGPPALAVTHALLAVLGLCGLAWAGLRRISAATWRASTG